MWLSEKMAEAPAVRETGGVGTVSVSGEEPAVVTDGELRRTRVCAPGGYFWRPAVGQQVTLLRGEEDCILGVLQEDSPAPGEIVISNGQASIRLTADGKIELSGEIYCNGERLEDLIH